MKNINVFGYATFGTPNGFTQSCIYGNQTLEKVLKKFDLKSDAIQLLSPNDRIYSIRQEIVQNNIISSYSVYTYAKEKSSNRSGTFIGTSLVFTNEVLPENLILSSLHDIHQGLKNNNVSQNILTINHSKDFNLENIFLPDFEKLEFQTQKFDYLEWENSGKNLVVFIPKFGNNEIKNLFKKSFQLLPKFDTIYFIDSKEIAEFVSQKKLFRIIDINGLDQEIEKLKQERKQKITDAIARFEKEKSQLEEVRKKSSDDLQKQIDSNEQKHNENGQKIGESKNNLNTLNTVYQNHIKVFDELIAGLKSDKKLQDVNKAYTQQKTIFEDNVRKLEKTGSIQNLTNPRTTNNFIQQNRQSDIDYNEEKYERKRTGKLDTFKLVSFILNVVLILAITSAYVYYTMYYKKDIQQEINTINNDIDSANAENSFATISKLNPFPNDSLTVDNSKKVTDGLKDSTQIKTVVKLIFDKNPESIGNIYKYQKGDYTKLLLDKNPAIFTITNNDTILLKKDLLKVIPSLKSSK